MTSLPVSRKTMMVGCFLAIYFLWGSTYLAVAIGLKSIPPFLLMAFRSFGGGLLLLLLTSHGANFPRSSQWLRPAVCGLLFFVGCHGVLAYAQQSVASGVAAIMLATIPFWIALLNFAFPSSRPPSARTLLALVPGFAGVAIIGWQQTTDHAHPTSAISLLLLLGCAFSWALGTRLAQRHPTGISTATLSGIELTIGGAALFAAGLVSGEVSEFSVQSLAMESVLALAYLMIAGTVIGFAAYVWLLDNISASLVSTYTFVNPVIAVLLGWTFLNERPTGLMLAGGALVVISVIAVWRFEHAHRSKSSGSPGRPGRPSMATVQR